MKQLVALYQAHGRFYVFVTGLEGAVVAALSAYFSNGGSLPTTKTAAYAFGGFVLKAAWGYLKAYAQGGTNGTGSKQVSA